MIVTAADSIHAVRWANTFNDRGHEVVFVAIKGHEVRNDSLNSKIKVVYLPVSGSKGYIFNALKLRKIWKAESPDITNAHYASGYGLLVRLARIHPLVLSVWGSDVYDFPMESSFKRKIVIKNLRYADAIASTSNCMAEQVKKLIGAPERNITITPFGVETDVFSPEGPVRLKDNKVFLFGTVKKLTYKYGIDYIIKAFSLFYGHWKKEKKDTDLMPHLFICGKGDDKTDFEKLRDQLGLHDLVEITGYIPHEEIPALLRSVDVFCLGSIKESESFGVAAVEAMSCGVPVIATDVDGFKEVMIDGKTGFIVPKKNEEALAEKMWELYWDSEKRIQLGNNGREHVVQNYEWNNNSSILIDLLYKVANK